jgi:hypothetical protein
MAAMKVKIASRACLIWLLIFNLILTVTAVVIGAFFGLTGLTTLWARKDNVAHGCLMSLLYIALLNNRITSIPNGAFSGLASLNAM